MCRGSVRYIEILSRSRLFQQERGHTTGLKDHEKKRKVLFELGIKDGAVVRALAWPGFNAGPGSMPARVQCRPGFNVGPVLFVVEFVGYRFASRVFLRVPRFSSLNKNQHSG